MSADGQDDVVMMCSFHAGAGLFGIDTRQIREVLGPTTPQPVPLAPEYIDGVVAYRGEALTAFGLRTLLGLEKRTDPGCVLVLVDDSNGERFGLVVDRVGGVVTMARIDFKPNPSTLDERSTYLFDGICGTEAGLMVRLDPSRLRPSRLAQAGLFEMAKQSREGESESEHRS
jgi:purine-binding chemotaxis protein CheW